MEPYYTDDSVTLYHGDCREVGVEIDERYCEITAKRLTQDALDFSGGVA